MRKRGRVVGMERSLVAVEGRGRLQVRMRVRISPSATQESRVVRLRRDGGAAKVSTRRGYARFRLPEGESNGGVDGRMNAPDNRCPPLCGTAVLVAYLHLATSGPCWQMERL